MENNQTCTGEDAINELVAISNGTEADAASPSEGDVAPAGFSELVDEELLDNPAKAMFAGPAVNKAIPLLDF